MSTLRTWNHPTTGQTRVYCNGRPAWDSRKVWIEENTDPRRPSCIDDFEIKGSGRFRVDEMCELAMDALRGAGIDITNTSFSQIVDATN